MTQLLSSKCFSNSLRSYLSHSQVHKTWLWICTHPMQPGAFQPLSISTSSTNAMPGLQPSLERPVLFFSGGKLRQNRHLVFLFSFLPLSAFSSNNEPITSFISYLVITCLKSLLSQTSLASLNPPQILFFRAKYSSLEQNLSPTVYSRPTKFNWGMSFLWE